MGMKASLAVAFVLCVSIACLAEEKALTSQDVLKKCGEVYKDMKTYYEEGEFTGAVGDGSACKYMMAFKRPDVFRWDMKSDEGGVLFHKGNETIMYEASENQYSKLSGDLQSVLKQIPVIAIGMKFAADPYDYVKANATSIGALSEADLGGKKVHCIAIASADGVSLKMYVDKETFRIVGADADQDGEKISMRVSRALINETPKDASGKEIDAFDYKLPADATEMEGPAAAPAVGSTAP